MIIGQVITAQSQDMVAKVSSSQKLWGVGKGTKCMSINWESIVTKWMSWHIIEMERIYKRLIYVSLTWLWKPMAEYLMWLERGLVRDNRDIDSVYCPCCEKDSNITKCMKCHMKPGVDLMEIKRTWASLIWVSVSLLWKRIEYDKMP